MGGLPASRPSLRQGAAHLLDVAREWHLVARAVRGLHLRSHVRRVHARVVQRSRGAKARGVLPPPLLLRQDLPRRATFPGASEFIVLARVVSLFLRGFPRARERVLWLTMTASIRRTFFFFIFVLFRHENTLTTPPLQTYTTQTPCVTQGTEKSEGGNDWENPEIVGRCKR